MALDVEHIVDGGVTVAQSEAKIEPDGLLECAESGGGDMRAYP